MTCPKATHTYCKQVVVYADNDSSGGTSYECAEDDSK